MDSPIRKIRRATELVASVYEYMREYRLSEGEALPVHGMQGAGEKHIQDATLRPLRALRETKLNQDQVHNV
jgi:hypothetical protein